MAAYIRTHPGSAPTVKQHLAAIVTGGSRPRVGEVFWLFLRTTRQWKAVAVTDVVDGRPGHWCVRKRFVGHDEVVRPLGVNGGDAERPSAGA